MQRLNQFFRKWIACLVDNQINTAEMVHRLYDIIHVHRLISSHTNGIRLEDVTCLVVRQAATLDMVRVIGQVYLRFVIDTAFHLHLFLLA